MAVSHAVHFYENDDELSARVAAFIGEALLAGEPAVIIASPPHRQQFIARLAAMNVDVEAERTAGNLTILDAAATLGKFMVGDSPDRELFTRVVGSPIESIGTRGNRWVKVRAYGEMVDLLGKARIDAAAIALEEMWTDLGAVYPFDLLCAYAMAAFAGGAGQRGRPRRSAASIRTSRSPRRRTEARTRPGDRLDDQHRSRRATWPRRSRAASRSRQPCAAPCRS